LEKHEVAVSNRLPASKARGSTLLAKDFTHGRAGCPKDLMKHPAASGGVLNAGFWLLDSWDQMFTHWNSFLAQQGNPPDNDLRYT
jgi:hypothetical protein